VYDREEWRRLLRTARNHRILHTPIDWLIDMHRIVYSCLVTFFGSKKWKCVYVVHRITWVKTEQTKWTNQDVIIQMHVSVRLYEFPTVLWSTSVQNITFLA
jgi:hypothetical protein